MAKDPKLDIDTEEIVAEAPAKPKSYRLHILIGLVCLALLQTIVLYLMIPTPRELRDDIDQLRPQIAGVPIEVDPNVLPEGEMKKEELVEKPLGEKFQVQDVRKGAEQTIDSFTVTIHVQVFKKDDYKFTELYTKKEFEIRDAVTEVLRGTTVDERSEVSLQTIRRKVMKRVNEVLGIPYIRGVLCTEPKVDTM
ncbi:MAG: flagellar basal body-associated FliL family protein [Planctomycetaceae bacterium]|jgi:flagellar basal body-associated protein FliL|nr:flagellar basal body-associated FliL family protein [Planctomycetaceae bacterium]